MLTPVPRGAVTDALPRVALAEAEATWDARTAEAIDEASATGQKV